MKIIVTRGWRVRAEHAVNLELSATRTWGQMRDVEWFLTRDPLHVRVCRTDGASSAASWSGAPIVISHRLFGVGPDRVGRVLAWQEGKGFAISDLSRRGDTVGFPHVCAYRVEPRSERTCCLICSVRGVWTARWMPRFVVRVWLWWVLAATGARIAGDLKRFVPPPAPT